MKSEECFIWYKRLYTLSVQTFASRNFRDFREFWPFSRKFMLLKILNRPIRESLCSRKKITSKIRESLCSRKKTFKKRFCCVFVNFLFFQIMNEDYSKYKFYKTTVCIKSIDFNHLHSLFSVNTACSSLIITLVPCTCK